MNLLGSMENNDNDKHLPLCSICMGSSDSKYMKYNLAVSGIILPIIGFIGIIGNSLVMTVYGNIEQRNFSTNIYLAALAFSDFSMIWTAIILYSIEAWRHHGPVVLSVIYVRSAEFVFPISTMLQTTSVYFCVAAAADSFVRIVLSAKIKDKICTPRFARLLVLSIAIISFLYNVPHFFELKIIDCIDEARNNTLSVQVCPTELRNNALYYELYYTYMYTIFMAAGPLLIIVTLNASIVRVVLKNGASEDSDTISLIVVVFMFIFCNSAALLVNFIEMFFADKVYDVLIYLVDMSNLLVIINCTSNFFCYLFFGGSFRRTLRKILIGWSSQFDLESFIDYQQ
uniref:G_PROTEIN_RECEP_F1_2 domain-containing protein n=1 Tax=Onchocerca volvulus TaxID=6282 RepID=A0A2K6VJD2_ONCVO